MSEDEGDRSRIDLSVRERAGRVRAAGATLADHLGSAGDRAGDAMQTFRFRAAVSVGVALIAVLLLEYWMVTRWFGAVDAMLYTLTFLFAASFLPVMILLFGHAMPGSGLLGRLHIIFAHIAYRFPYLLDRGDRWEYAPGTKDAVWIHDADGDGAYVPIKSGEDNRNVLGWRPFGIVLDKTTVDLEAYRVDTAAERDARAADGGMVFPGANDQERGGFEKADEPIATGIDGTWVVDLTDVFTRGVRKLADTDILDITEEVTKRKEQQPGTFSQWRIAITSLVGFVIGWGLAFMTF